MSTRFPGAAAIVGIGATEFSKRSGRSELALTEFGKAIVVHSEDFSRHNPIDRWWGGTHLTSERLWRWNPALIRP